MLIVKNNIIPFIIGIMSLLGLYENLDFLNLPNGLVSILGIATIVFYYFDKNKAFFLMKIWIYAQEPYIINETSVIGENGSIINQTLIK